MQNAPTPVQYSCLQAGETFAVLRIACETGRVVHSPLSKDFLLYEVVSVTFFVAKKVDMGIEPMSPLSIANYQELWVLFH